MRQGCLCGAHVRGARASRIPHPFLDFHMLHGHKAHMLGLPYMITSREDGLNDLYWVRGGCSGPKAPCVGFGRLPP